MSNNNQIVDLRDMLFDQMRRLSDPNCNLDKEMIRTEGMVGIGKTIIESAKAETDFLRVTGAAGSGFIPSQQAIDDGTTKRLAGGKK